MSDWTTRVEKDVAPPDAVRARVVEGLRREGLLPSRRRAARPWLQAAAALLLFAAGWMAGAGNGPDAPSPPRYMLLLFGETSTPADLGARVAEYGAWARASRDRGTEMTGERLEAAAVAVGGPSPAGLDALGGYFIVEAPSMDAARALAEGHPHVRYGGTIVIRPLAGG